MRLKKFYNVFVATLLLLNTSLAIAPQVQAQDNFEWTGVCVGGPENDVATIQGFQCLIANLLSVAFTMIGLAGFAMFIFGSFMWLLSGGDSGKVSKARQAMTYSIVGIVVALSSYMILNLIYAFTGVNVTQFIIPAPDS